MSRKMAAVLKPVTDIAPLKPRIEARPGVNQATLFDAHAKWMDRQAFVKVVELKSRRRLFKSQRCAIEPEGSALTVARLALVLLAQAAAAARDTLLWPALCVAVVTALLTAPAPGRGFGWDFSMTLGYAAIAMLGVQFALTARFRRATALLGAGPVTSMLHTLARCHEWRAFDIDWKAMIS